MGTLADDALLRYQELIAAGFSRGEIASATGVINKTLDNMVLGGGVSTRSATKILGVTPADMEAFKEENAGPRVDAAAVYLHIARLRAAGLRPCDIVRSARCNPNSVMMKTRGKFPKTLPKGVVDRILALEVPQAHAHTEKTYVGRTTIRRALVLLTFGWSQQYMDAWMYKRYPLAGAKPIRAVLGGVPRAAEVQDMVEKGVRRMYADLIDRRPEEGCVNAAAMWRLKHYGEDVDMHPEQWDWDIDSTQDPKPFDVNWMIDEEVIDRLLRGSVEWGEVNYYERIRLAEIFNDSTPEDARKISANYSQVVTYAKRLCQTREQ